MRDGANDDSGSLKGIGRAGAFQTTMWGVVLEAGQSNSQAAGEALELLCRIYWKPLFYFARAQGRSQHDAEDLTQGFFGHLLNKSAISKADPAKGKFRTFLITAFKNFLGQDRQRNTAQKRGGNVAFVPFDEISEADSTLSDAARNENPDALYERQFATALIETTLRQLESEYHTTTDKSAKFVALREAMACSDDKIPAAELGAKLGMTEGAVRVALFRLRRRYQEIFRAEVLRTIEDPVDLEDELRHIRRVLGS